MSRRKRKKRLRIVRTAERHTIGGDAARFRWAATIAIALGLACLAAAMLLSWALPGWNRSLGPSGNVALRVAGVALVIASVMFDRFGK